MILRYCITLLYSRIVITSNSYCSEHIEPVITSYSYRSDVIDKVYCIFSLSLLGKKAFKSINNKILFCYLRQKYTQKIMRKVFANVWEQNFCFTYEIRGEESNRWASLPRNLTSFSLKS